MSLHSILGHFPAVFININHNNADFRTIANHYSFSPEQPAERCSSYHGLLGFIVPVLFTALQIRYQPKETAPSETHPKSFAIALATLLIYCFLWDAQIRFSSIRRHPTYAAVVRHGKVCVGSLLWVSLATILLPDSLAPVLYCLCILFSAGEFLFYPFQKLWIRANRLRGQGHGFSRMEALLPV